MKKLALALLLVFGLAATTAPVFGQCLDNTCNLCCTNDDCSDCDVVCQPCDPCDCKASNQTFFATRPQFQVGSPEYLSAFRDRMRVKEDGKHGAIQFFAGGGRSSDRGKLATYFTPDCQTELRVREDSTTVIEGTDVIAGQFNIVTVNGNFESIISFAPRQSTFNFGMSYLQRLSPEDKEQAYWIGINAPLTYVRNTMGFVETVIENGGGTRTADPVAGAFSANMTEAFRQSRFNCGQINKCCNLTKTRIADIDVRLGRELVNMEECYLDTYVGVLIPTGNRVGDDESGRQVFEPVVGHRRHVGLNFGTGARIELWASEEGDRYLELSLDVHGLYLIRNCQRRLLGLKNKPWGQYMQMYKDKDQATEADNANGGAGNDFIHTPGVNILCQCLRVSPGFQRTINTGIIYTCNNIQGELGYNFFAREAECVELKECWKEGPALKSLAGSGETDSVQVIGNVFADNNQTTLANYDSNLIKQSDLDLNAAAHPCMITHTVYGSLSYRWDDREDYPMFAGLGGSIEFATDNTGMDRWMLWAKGGVSF